MISLCDQLAFFVEELLQVLDLHQQYPLSITEKRLRALRGSIHEIIIKIKQEANT